MYTSSVVVLLKMHKTAAAEGSVDGGDQAQVLIAAPRTQHQRENPVVEGGTLKMKRLKSSHC